MKKYILKNAFCLLIPGILIFSESCNKNANFLNGNSGTWEIESMQLDFLNSSGPVDSTITSGITGFFMFYDTPTTGSDPYYLGTNGFTIKGHEQHAAHFWKSDGNTITMVTTVGQLIPARSYAISDHKKNEMTIDYTGPADGMYYNYNSYTGDVKEHIVLKRIKF